MDTLNCINILHLEDDSTDSQMVQYLLKKANIHFNYYLVDTEEEFHRHLKNSNIDIILSDFNMPEYSGSEALLWAKTNFPFIPFVFVSGALGEDAAIESMRNGATDYVLKNKMDRLGIAVSRAYQEAREKKARRKAENELIKLSMAVKQSSNIILITNSDGLIEYANPATYKQTGYSADELIGQKPSIFSSGNKKKEDYKILWETIKSGKEWKGEFLNKKKNGELYWELATISPVFSEENKISHFVAIKEDITEGKKLTQELIKAKEKAEESDRLKTAFLNNISHEIRTPMNAIIGFSHYISSEEITLEKRIFFTDIIIKSCEQLLSIITDIIRIATIEAGQEKITETEVELNEMLKLLYQQYLLKAEKQKIQLKLSIPEQNTELFILSDKAKLNQILSHILNNGLKFTKLGQVEFGYKINGIELEFYVEDTGIGIHPDMQEAIFQLFRQVELGATRKYGGQGLGLSIAKAYVEMMGGKIWLKSEVDKGTIFYFTIPYKPCL